MPLRSRAESHAAMRSVRAERSRYSAYVPCVGGGPTRNKQHKPTTRTHDLHRSVGVPHAVDSRDISFGHDALTLGAVPDVILNSLTSPGMVAASIAAMRLGGR